MRALIWRRVVRHTGSETVFWKHSVPLHGLVQKTAPSYNSLQQPARVSPPRASLSAEVTAADYKISNPKAQEELSQLLDLLPGSIRTRVEEHPERDALVEIVLDLGRRPMARFPSGDVFLSEDVVTAGDIEFAVGKVCLTVHRICPWFASRWSFAAVRRREAENRVLI